MTTVRLRNINPLGRVDLPLVGREGDKEGEGIACLEPGEVFAVPAALAGRPPSGKPGDLGEGLLAQVGNYELADKPPARKRAPRKAAKPKAAAPAAAPSAPKGDA
jgi:hypothetical protein